MPFYNPYNFIPATPRTNANTPEGLRDGKPPAHGWLAPDLYTGILRVRMTCVTPLILLDHLNATASRGHKSYPVRTNPDGSPGLAPAAIKGMLSSAFEIVTNSRWRVFHKWDKRLSHRSEPGNALELVPAIVTENGDIQLMLGNNTGLPELNGDRLRPPGNLMYAAFLPMNGSMPSHRQKVRFWVQRFRRGNTFTYDRVLRWEDAAMPAGVAPDAIEGTGNHQHVNGFVMGPLEGTACLTGLNIGNKHFERIIFGNPCNLLVVDSDEHKKVKETYEDLVRDYQRAHEPDDGVRDRVPSMPGTQFSRHIGFNGSSHSDSAVQNRERKLQPGDVLYVRMDQDGTPVAGYPVHISREPFEMRVNDTLPWSLKPATHINDLSPADRVFGWVPQNAPEPRQGENGTTPSAYRGNLRVTHVVCAQGARAIQLQQRTLAILGSPKPSYTRFYCGDDQRGAPFTGKRGSAFMRYQTQSGQEVTKGPRGRKVYPHHQGWHGQYSFAVDGTNQNCTIQGWVREQTVFTFDIYVKNLSRAELGALVYVLRLPDNRCLRLGYGKPLGFGSVRLDLDVEGSKVSSGSNWAEFFADLDHDLPGEMVDLLQTGSDFVGLLGPQRPGYLEAFLNSSAGWPAAQVHYPQWPGVAGEQFRWFGANEAGPRATLYALQGNAVPLPDNP